MSRRAAFALGLSLLVVGQAGQAQDGGAASPGVTIRSSAQEVVLDLVVRDSRGRAVKNLQPGDVSIFEDGVRQDIRNFRFVNGRAVVEQTSGKGKKERGATLTASANPLQAVNLVCIVFHDLDPYNRKNAMDAAREFLQSGLPPNAWVAVFSLDTRLNVLHAFTTNRSELMEAAASAFTGSTVDFMSVANAVLTASPTIVTIEESVNGTPAKGGTVTAGPVIAGGELNPRAINGADISNSPASNAQRGDVVSQRREFGAIKGMQAMDQLDDMIRQFGTLPGRKTVLFLSPGLATTGDADLFKSILDKANRAAISFYAVDTNGLTENSNGLASAAQLSHSATISAEQGAKTGSAADTMERMRQSDYTLDAVRTTDTQASLRALAEGTGGFLTGSTNDFRKSFRRIVEDVDTHYEATYHPASDKYDGHLRTIEVKLARPDWNVESRTGYFAMPDLGGSAELLPYEMTALAALNLRTLPHAFDFHTAALQFRPGTGDMQRELVFEVPARSLGSSAQPDRKRHRIHASILALVKDASGQVVEKFSQDSPYEIPDENLASAENSTVLFTHSVNLPPGHYRVDTAVLDRETKHVSTGSIEFNNPEPKGVGLSSIVLVQRLDPVKGRADDTNPFQFQAGEGQRREVIPELSATLKADAHPYVYFVIYPGKSSPEQPKIHVEFLVDGRMLAQQTVGLPPADASGAIPMVIAAAARPGKCEIRITALQGNASMQQSLTYTVL